MFALRIAVALIVCLCLTAVIVVVLLDVVDVLTSTGTRTMFRVSGRTWALSLLRNCFVSRDDKS